MAETLMDFTLKSIFKCIVSNYNLIHGLPGESEMLFRDFKRLTCVLEEAHEKNMSSKRLDNFVIELSDLAIKLNEMRKLILPQLQGLEKWNKLHDCLGRAKEVRKLRGELQDILGIVTALGIPNALNLSFRIMEAGEQISEDKLEARRKFCVELKKLIEDDENQMLANGSKLSAHEQTCCLTNPFKVKKPEVPVTNAPFSWSAAGSHISGESGVFHTPQLTEISPVSENTGESEVFYTAELTHNPQETPGRISGEEIVYVPRLHR